VSLGVAHQYDLVVIGAGTGGYVAAIRAAQLGLRTAVVERQAALGGTCLNVGCIPTKALLEHAHVFKLAKQGADWGIRFDGASTAPTLDLSRVHARKNKIVDGLTRGVEFLFKKNKVEWLKGAARLLGKGRVHVSGSGSREVIAREIIIATGSAPRATAELAIDGKQIITSDHAIHVDAIPRTLTILGSGAVGVEFASIFRQFGSDVTIVELLPRLAPAEDSAISTELERAFKKRGISIRTGTRVTSAHPSSSGVTLGLTASGGKADTMTVDKVLVAIGRVPVTDGLGIEDVGVAVCDGFIVVDEQFRTNVDGISAIGDVVQVGARRHPQLAHLAAAEGIVAVERIAGAPTIAIDYDQVPACTYCEPEIGSVGLTEQSARERGLDVQVGTFPFSALGRARIAGETEGFVKIVADRQYDQVLGVHIIGARATELVGEATVALRLESTVEELVRAIHAHPTMSEAIGEAAHALHGGPIHI